jgi:hypothetical protein
MSGLVMFWWLMVGHAVADFWAQSDSVAKMKNRNRDPSQFAPPGQKPQKMWFYALTAHALMHGAFVALVTGSVILGLAETAAHWLIDFGKCENWYGIHADQGMHFGCKVAWVALA